MDGSIGVEGVSRLSRFMSLKGLAELTEEDGDIVFDDDENCVSASTCNSFNHSFNHGNQ